MKLLTLGNKNLLLLLQLYWLRQLCCLLLSVGASAAVVAPSMVDKPREVVYWTQPHRWQLKLDFSAWPSIADSLPRTAADSTGCQRLRCAVARLPIAPVASGYTAVC